MSRKFGPIAAALFTAVTVASQIAHAQVTGPTGGGQPHSTVQPSIGLNYIVRAAVPNDSRSLTYIGEVAIFGGNYVPAGWKPLDGSLLSTADYPQLFGLISNNYGGNGTTTFALPDLRGRVPIGAGLGPGLQQYDLRQNYGSETVTLTEANLPAHDHTLPPSANLTGVTGAGQPYNNLQPSQALNFIMNVDINAAMPDPDGAPLPTRSQIRITLADTPPEGWALVQGQMLSIAQNTGLYALLGTTYGGNGSTTFALPDLRGRAAIGQGLGPGLTHQLMGQIDGEETHTLLTAELPSHTHTTPEPGVTGATGGSQPSENLQPALGMRYIISLQGAAVGAGPGNPDVSSVNEPMLGQIMLWPNTFVPAGWASCEGQFLSINQNLDLYQILGTIYGGNGTTTFALPDLRGRLGVDFGEGPGLQTWALGEKSGAEFYSLTVPEMPSHVHTLVVPEPASLGLLAIGAAGLMLRRRK